MRLARLVTPPTAAASLLSLLGIQDEMRGSVDVILQGPAGNSGNISMGDASQQPGFIVAGGSATLENANLKTTFVSGNGTDTLVILVIR